MLAQGNQTAGSRKYFVGEQAWRSGTVVVDPARQFDFFLHRAVEVQFPLRTGKGRLPPFKQRTNLVACQAGNDDPAVRTFHNAGSLDCVPGRVYPEGNWHDLGEPGKPSTRWI